MASHVFNIIAGGNYPKAAGGLTSGNVVTDYLQDESAGNAVLNNVSVLSNAPGGTDADNDVQLNFSATASSVTITAQDQASGSGDFVSITATATGPDGTLDYEGVSGAYGTAQYSSGVTEWYEEYYSPDGEGFYEVYLTIKWNGTTVYGPSFYNYQTTQGSYQRGTLQTGNGGIPGNGYTTRYYSVKQFDAPLTVFRKTGMTLTDYKIIWTTVTWTNAGGEATPLRNLAGSTLNQSGSTDSGWIGHAAADTALNIVHTQSRSPATTPFSGLITNTTGIIQFWTRNGSGDSGTMEKEFRMRVNTNSESS